MATIGRDAGEVQFLGGRTTKGLKASVGWGTRHLTLLPTHEDRSNTVMALDGAAMTHQRIS
jgi:hypothetical protein